MKICPKCKHKCDDSYMFCPACDFHMENVPPEDDVEEPIDIGGTLRKYIGFIIAAVAVVVIVLVFNLAQPFDMSDCSRGVTSSSSKSESDSGNSGGSSGHSAGGGSSNSSGEAAGNNSPSSSGQSEESASTSSESAPQESSTVQESANANQSQPSSNQQSNAGDASQSQSEENASQQQTGDSVENQESVSYSEEAQDAQTGDECVLSMNGEPVYFAKRKSVLIDAGQMQDSGDTASIEQLIADGELYVLTDGTSATIINNKIGNATFVDISTGDLAGSVGYVNIESLHKP